MAARNTRRGRAAPAGEITPRNATGDSPAVAVFLDRDGTIIEDLNYLKDPDRVLLLPGAVEALRLLQNAGYLLVVITNQSGVARGFFDEAACRAVDRRFQQMLAAEGVTVSASYYCPHLPGAAVAEYDVECECRKPAPGLFEKAAREFGVDCSRSWAVGDSLRDIIPAKELGARTVLVLTGKGTREAADDRCRGAADFVAENLAEATKVILGSG